MVLLHFRDKYQSFFAFFVQLKNAKDLKIKYLTTKLLQAIWPKVYSDLLELINDSRFLYTSMIASVTIIICFGLQHILINRFSIKHFCNNAFLKFTEVFECIRSIDRDGYYCNEV